MRRRLRLAHSLKRDIGPAAAYRHVDSPMSMTSPRTTLTSGQCAPLLHRSSAAPSSTLPQHRLRVFLRRDLRQGADYFANHASSQRRRAPLCRREMRSGARFDTWLASTSAAPKRRRGLCWRIRPWIPQRRDQRAYERHGQARPCAGSSLPIRIDRSPHDAVQIPTRACRCRGKRAFVVMQAKSNGSR